MHVTSIPIVLTVLVGITSAQFECPNSIPDLCLQDNPCDKATCPRFVTPLHCCPEVVNGKCSASFYRPNTRRPINPKLCFRNINYCTQTKCKGNRMCVEEVIPCIRGNCDLQTITAKCELIPQPLPPTDCEQVSYNYICGS